MAAMLASGRGRPRASAATRRRRRSILRGSLRRRVRVRSVRSRSRCRGRAPRDAARARASPRGRAGRSVDRAGAAISPRSRRPWNSNSLFWRRSARPCVRSCGTPWDRGFGARILAAPAKCRKAPRRRGAQVRPRIPPATLAGMERGSVTDDIITAFERDGAALVKGLFAPWVEELRAGIERNMADPGPYAAENLKPGDGGRFFDDYCNWTQIPEFGRVVRAPAVAAAAAALM